MDGAAAILAGARRPEKRIGDLRRRSRSFFRGKENREERGESGGARRERRG
jgi:hypothetical protein